MKLLNKNPITNLLLLSIILIAFIVVVSKKYDFISLNYLKTIVNSLGPLTLLIIIPYFFIIFIDTVGWLLCFGKNKSQLTIGRLFSIRLATETLQTSLPGGAFYAEIVRPYLLENLFGLEYVESVSANLITKVNIFTAQVIFSFIGISIFLITLDGDSASPTFLSNPQFYIVPILLITLIIYMIYRRNLLLKSLEVLKKIKLKRFQFLLNRIYNPIKEIDYTVSIFASKYKARLLLTIIVFLHTWLFMSVETLIILKILGIEATIFQAIFIESLISFVRMAFFFIPGAIGPQDVSIVALFSSIGIAEPVTSSIAFILLKRIKEAIWILAGYVFLIWLGVKPRSLIFKEKIDSVLAS